MPEGNSRSPHAIGRRIAGGVLADALNDGTRCDAEVENSSSEQAGQLDRADEAGGTDRQIGER